MFFNLDENGIIIECAHAAENISNPVEIKILPPDFSVRGRDAEYYYNDGKWEVLTGPNPHRLESNDV